MQGNSDRTSCDNSIMRAARWAFEAEWRHEKDGQQKEVAVEQILLL